MVDGWRASRACVCRASSLPFLHLYLYLCFSGAGAGGCCHRRAALRWVALVCAVPPTGWLAGRPVGRLVRRPFGCDNRRRLSPNSATRCNAIAPVRHAPGKQGDPDSNRSPGARSRSGCLRRRLQTAHCRLRRPHRSEIRLSLSEGEHRLTHRSRPRSAEAGAETTLSPAPVSELVTRWRSGATY